MTIARRALAVLLSFLIAAAAVPHQAAAQIIVGGAALGATSGAAGGVPRIELSGTAFAPLSPAIGLVPAQIPALPVSALASGPLAVVPVQAAQAARPIDAAKVPLRQLALIGEKLSAAAAEGSDKADVLNPFFTGERELAGRLDVPVAAASALAPILEGQATPPTPITLEAMAIDSQAPLAGRRAAVAQLAKSEGWKESLERVSAANPDGNAADYEVHRAALIALAEQGVVISLRPVSRAHKEEIVAGLSLRKPASAVFDYDDTLAKLREPISAPVAAGLQAANAAGVKTAILTDRVNVKTNAPDVAIMVASAETGIKALRESRGFAGPMLLVGDSFFGVRMADADMTKAAGAGSLTLAVGGLADPRIANAFVWPTKGAEASAEILAALGKIAPAAEEMDKRAIGGLFAQRTVSIIVFILTSIAYPLITIPAVGVASYGALMALGPLAAIATGPLNGLIADRMSARNGLALMAAMRGLLALALPAFALFGILNFWTLLLASIANGWLLSSLMITEGTYIRRLAGAKNVPMVNGLAAINYLTLQVLLGLVIGVGQYVDHFSLLLPFYISAVVHAALVIPIIWKTIPNIKPASSSAKAAANFAATARAKGKAVEAFFAKYWKEAALFAASVGAYFLWHSALPISGALMFWISRSDGFKAIWAQKNLRWSMLLSALLAGLAFPMQSLALPLMASTLGGVAGKGLILGQLLGAYFFGQLIANAGQLSAPTGAVKMPDIAIPFAGKTISFERLVSGVVLGLAAVWAGVRLFPGSLAAAAAAVAIGAALLYGSSKLSARGWIKFLGVGLAGVLLPFAFWGSMPVLFAGVLLLGLFAGPSLVVLSSYFQTNAKSANLGAAIGVNGSTFNAAVSFGYGLMSLIVGLFTPAFPGALGPIGLIFLAAGACFFFTPRLLPGLPGSSVNQSSTK